MAWRFRKCPECQQVQPAGDLISDWDTAEGWTAGEMLRSCPLCQYTGQTKSFPVVYQTNQRGVIDNTFEARKRKAMKEWKPIVRLHTDVVLALSHEGCDHG